MPETVSGLVQLSIYSAFGWAGIVIISVFIIVGVSFYFLVIRTPILMSIGLFEGALALFVGGYAVYTSASDLVIVAVACRICYVGAVLVPLFLVMSYKAITGNRKPYKNPLILASTFLALAVLVFDRTYVLTDRVVYQELKHYYTLETGPLFFVLFSWIMGVVLYAFINFSRFFLSNRRLRRLLWPVEAGLGLWILSSLRDGLVAVTNTRTEVPLPWLGPVILTFMIAIYLGLMSREHYERLRTLHEEKNRLESKLNYDELTGVRTREAFLAILGFEMERMGRESNRVDSILFIDMDEFKTINDSLGHAAGDRLLGTFGRVLHDTIRASDIAGRYGGDEFLVLLLDCSTEAARCVAEKLRAEYRSAAVFEFGTSLPKNHDLSIGIVSSTDWGIGPADALKRADAAMYCAKRSREEKVIVFSYPTVSERLGILF